MAAPDKYNCNNRWDGGKETGRASELIDTVLRKVKIVGDREYEIDESLRNEVRDKVEGLCSRFAMR